MRTQPDVQEFQHGTTTGYRYGCKCDPCAAAVSDYAHDWRTENLEYMRDYWHRARAKRQAQSRASATRFQMRWEPHEDALLAHIPSNIAAASALGRTVRAVAKRRRTLRLGSTT